MDRKKANIDFYNQIASAWSNGSNPGDFVEEFTKILALAAAQPTRYLLDLGCSSAEIAGWFLAQKFSYTGVDAAPKMLALARKYNPEEARFFEANCDKLPFPGGEFNFVWAAAILHHIPHEELPQVLAEMHRVTQPGAIAYIFTEAGSGIEERPYPDDQSLVGYFFLWNFEDLIQKFTEAGFELIERLPDQNRALRFFVRRL